MLAAVAGEDPAKPWYAHEHNLRESVEYLDNVYQVYAAAYKQVNGKLYLFTKRNFATSILDPMSYPGFVEAIRSRNSGYYVIGYTPDNQTYRDMHLYFRWMPLYADADKRYLVVSGVSRYSVVTQIPIWVSIGQWVSMAVLFALEVWLVIQIKLLGHIWGMRSGEKLRDKWRGGRT